MLFFVNEKRKSNEQNYTITKGHKTRLDSSLPLLPRTVNQSTEKEAQVNTTPKNQQHEKAKVSVNKAIDQLFHRFAHNRETCNVTITLVFNQGGLRNSRISFDHPDLLTINQAISSSKY